MSQENVEIVKAAIAAVNRGDWDAAVKDAAPGAEVDLSRAAGPVHGIFGLDQWLKTIREYADSWETLRAEPHEFIDAGEHVVVPWTLHAVGRDEVHVETRVTWVWTIRDGAIERASMYQERQDALDAVGLRE